MQELIVKKSKIHGRGVFARRDFNKGEKVIDWSKCTEKISEKEFAELSKNEKRYVSFINGKYIHFFAPARYLNHSCDNNTETINLSDTAIKDIKKGEEITANYLQEKVPGLKIKCNCGSKNCKKILEV